MTTPRPHPFANRPRQIQDVTMLQNPVMWNNDKLEYHDTIVDKIDDESYNEPIISLQTIQDWINMSNPSLVGKGDVTELDPEVRSSTEILAERITLNPNFVEMINTLVPVLGEKLLHPYQVKAEFYKMVIYQEGDHFHSHMDAPHKDNMVMTLSVELTTETGRSGGYLVPSDLSHLTPEYRKIVDEEEYEDTEEDDDKPFNSYAIFYHDLSHEVTNVKQGYKISIIFDIIETPVLVERILDQFRPSFINGLKSPVFLDNYDKPITKIKVPKLSKIGFLTNHVYMTSKDCTSIDQDFRLRNKIKDKVIVNDISNIIADYVSEIKLKGVDRIASILLREAGADIYLVEVFEEGDNIYHKKLLPIMKLSESFSPLYRRKERDEDSDNGYFNEINNNDTSCIHCARVKRGHGYFYNNNILNYDSNNECAAIKDEYLLGDVCFIQSNSKSKIEYNGDDEVHLGNESFSGEIYSNLAVIATFPK